MASGLSTQLTRQIGEHLVTAELGRRGIIATPFAGNVPDIDILAFANGKSTAIQVKAINSVSWQFDIRKFLDVTLGKKEQIVHGINKNLDRSLACIFVKIGSNSSEDSYYIFKQGWLQDYFKKTYNGRELPKNVKSFHCAIWEKDVLQHKDKWETIYKKLDIQFK